MNTKLGSALPDQMLWSRKRLGFVKFISSEKLCVPRSRLGSLSLLASCRTVSSFPEGTTCWAGWGP